MTSPTMSSLEIAKLTGKQHAHVLRDIRNLLSQLAECAKQAKYHDLDSASPEYNRGERQQYKYLKPSTFDQVADHFKKGYPDLDHPIGVTEKKDSRGYTTEYLLDHDHALTLVAGYRVDLRLRIIQRWHELEAQQAQGRLTPAEHNALLAKQGKVIVDRDTAPASPRNAQFHQDTLDRLSEASCRFSVAQELAERVGLNTDGNDDPARTFCNDAWAIAYLVEDGQKRLEEAIAVLLPLTRPRDAKPAVAPAPTFQTPQPPAEGTQSRMLIDMAGAIAPQNTQKRRWKDPDFTERVLKSMRLKVEEMYDLSIITPERAERMYQTGAIGPRQIGKLRELMA